MQEVGRKMFFPYYYLRNLHDISGTEEAIFQSSKTQQDDVLFSMEYHVYMEYREYKKVLQLDSNPQPLSS